MKVLFYSSHPYEESELRQSAGAKHQITLTTKALSTATAELAKGYDAVSLFTGDDASAPVLRQLSAAGVRYLALRSVGYDHVDLKEAAAVGIRVANVPEYSPNAIAEHAVAMLLAVNRKIVEGHLLLQLQDFRIDSLKGFDIHGKTVGIIATGKIGLAFASIMKGFGARLLAFDPVVNATALDMGIQYLPLNQLLAESDIVSLHCPLNANTRYMIAKPQFDVMKPGSILINTARGGVVKTADLITAIEEGKLRAACLDVYENEKGLFFHDHRNKVIKDPMFSRLRSFPNVLITSHQAFLTNEAIAGIAGTTGVNLDSWEKSGSSPNEVTNEL